MSDTKTILVVEDEQPLRTALVQALDEAGYTVVEATNGEEGLQAFQTHQPNLVLLDNLMPIMDGATMLAKLQEQGLDDGCRVIMLTNVNELDALNASLMGGASDYLIKSDIDLKELRTIVDKHFEEV